MTDCSDLAGPLAQIADTFRWTCRQEGDVVRLATGRRRANSDPIVLRVRVDGGDQVVASDGGDTLANLADVGFDLDDSVHAAVWQSTLSDYRLRELDGRVFIQAPVAQAVDQLSRLADALVALDALRVLAIPPRFRPRTLADQVEDYLTQTLPQAEIRRRPTVRLSNGVQIQPSLAVGRTGRPELFVQPGATTSKTQSFDHAFSTFTMASDTGVRHDRQLTILGGRADNWDLRRLRKLSDVCFVGFFTYMEPVANFLHGDVPDDPLMTPPGLDVPLLTRSEPATS